MSITRCQGIKLTLDVKKSLRWLILAGISFQYFCFALVHFSTSALASEISSDLGFGYAGMGAIMGAWPMIYIFLSIPAGLAVDQFGSRILLYLGIAMISMSTILRGSAANFQEMYLAFVIFGIGAPLVSIGIPKVVREWFDVTERGTALGITMACVAVGSVMGLVLSRELLDVFHFHWRDIYGLYAIICAVSLFSWLIIVLSFDSSWILTHKQNTNAPRIRNRVGMLLSDNATRLTLITAVGVLFYLHATINWLPEILHQQAEGLTAAKATNLAALPIIIAAVSALVMPGMAKRFSVVTVLAFLFLSAAASCMLLALFSGMNWIYLALLLNGMVRGALLPLATLLVMQLEGVNNSNMGLAMGLFFSFGQVGGFMGPMGLGHLAEFSAGFEMPLIFLTVFCMILAILVHRIKIYQN